MSPADSESDDRPDETTDALDDGSGEDRSASSASDPEAARQEAEEALAEIEAMADLDDDPEVESEASGDEAPAAGDPDAPDPQAAGTDDEGVPEDQCENCGAMLHGPYCSQCGQKSADRIVPLWHMLNEALEAVIELDMRVLHTIPKFLFLPGRLTKEYLNGRRKRYIRPFRLFLFATFILFTVLALSTTGGFGLLFSPSSSRGLSDAAPTAGADTTQTATADTVRSAPAGARPSPSQPGGKEDTTTITVTGHSNLSVTEWLWGSQTERSRAADSIRKALAPEPSDDRVEAALKRNLPRVVEHPFAFLEATIDRGPYLMFFMIPIFALLLKLLYVRRGRLYVEHMIFSLHMHAFTFFAFTGGILLEQSDATGLGVAAMVVNASPLLYLVLALSHVYEQGIVKSSIKALFLLSIYAIILSIGFALLIVLVIGYFL